MNGEKLRALGDEIARTMNAIDRTEHRLLGLLREFDEAGGWEIDGATSLAAWLSWRTGMSPAAARERARVARALVALPAIDRAFGAGGLSYSKARAVTRVATEENEGALLSMARGMTASELERLSRVMRSADVNTEVEPARRFSQRTDASGMVRMTFIVTADEAAAVVAAVDACASAPNRRAEGLVAMADECLRGSAPERSPTEVILHVAAEDLSGHTDEGRGVSAEAARRALCDCGVVAMVRDAAGKTVDVGRKTRTIPAATRRALKHRDRGCRFPGCDHVIVDGHHIEHWADGGETALENLVSLCRVHHRFVHEGGVVVEATGGELVFRGADGRALRAEVMLAEPLAPSDDAWAAVAQDDSRPLDWDAIGAALA